MDTFPSRNIFCTATIDLELPARFWGKEKDKVVPPQMWFYLLVEFLSGFGFGFGVLRLRLT